MLTGPDEQLVELGWGYGLPGTANSRCGAWVFAFTGTDPQAALDAARKAWLERITRDARLGVDYPFGDLPNWGDFMLFGDEELAAHGLRRVDASPAIVLDSVDHDTVIGIVDTDAGEAP